MYVGGKNNVKIVLWKVRRGLQLLQIPAMQGLWGRIRGHFSGKMQNPELLQKKRYEKLQRLFNLR